MNSQDEEIIYKYLNGTCSEDEVRQILEWIEASEENKKFLFNLKFSITSKRFDKFSDVNHLQQSYNELMRLSRYKEEIEQQVYRKIRINIYKYAAAILLLISLSTGAYLITTRQHSQPENLLMVSVDNNEMIRQITLEDSTKVWLASNSRIEYPQRFSKKSRTVKIEGRAYFEVTKDTQRPFFVDMGSCMVKVTGTSFEATNYPEMKQSDIILNEGSVDILNPKQKKLCSLKPGNQFEIEKQSGLFQVKPVNSAFLTSWKTGVLEFDGLPFSEISKALERYYGVHIISNSTEMMNQRLVGSLNLKKDITEMMKAIKIVIPMEYEIEVNTCVYIDDRNERK